MDRIQQPVIASFGYFVAGGSGSGDGGGACVSGWMHASVCVSVCLYVIVFPCFWFC